MGTKDQVIRQHQHPETVPCSVKEKKKSFNKPSQKIEDKINITRLKKQTQPFEEIRKIFFVKHKNYVKTPRRKKVFHCIFSAQDLLKSHSRLSYLDLDGFDEYVARTITLVFNNKNVSNNKCKTISWKDKRPKNIFLRQFLSNIHPKKEHDDYVGKDQSAQSIFMKSFQTNKSYLYMTSDKTNVGAKPRHRSSEGSIALPKHPSK